MNKLVFILTFAICSNTFGQVKFIIKEYINDDSVPKLNRSNFKLNSDIIFEDSLYSVSKSCSGEWGGTIKFKNKKSGIEFSAASTCPVIVNKLNDKYYITNNLAHLSGFSEVLEITNPEALEIFKLPQPRRKKGNIVFLNFGDTESKSRVGTKQLVDTNGVQTITSFPYKGQLYHIVTDYEKTYLTKIVNTRYETIDTISNQRLWTYNPEIFRTTDNHFIVFFDNSETKGYFDIYENSVTIVRQQ